jgi:hypothetical protein
LEVDILHHVKFVELIKGTSRADHIQCDSFGSGLMSLWFLLPQEHPVDRGGNIDWIGATLGAM